MHGSQLCIVLCHGTIQPLQQTGMRPLPCPPMLHACVCSIDRLQVLKIALEEGMRPVRGNHDDSGAHRIFMLTDLQIWLLHAMHELPCHAPACMAMCAAA